MAAKKNDDDLQRWRGEVSAKLDFVSSQITDLVSTIKQQNVDFSERLAEHAAKDEQTAARVASSIAKLEMAGTKVSTKVAVIWGIAASLVGGLASALAATLMK